MAEAGALAPREIWKPLPKTPEILKARQIAWAAGLIASWHLRPSQLECYDLLLRTKRPHLECARQYGKTTTILDFVCELLNLFPGWICRWCEPWKEQCHEIVVPAVKEIQQWAPKSRQMRWKEKGSQFIHPNGSLLYLRGVNEDRGEASRGPHSHIIVADEFGSWRHARYIVDEVLKPQLETTNGWFICASTPPEDLGHLYYEYFDRAYEEGRVIQKTILDNESLSDERVSQIIIDCGGKETPAWRRERMLERVTDPAKLVVPEYKEDLCDLPDDWPAPPFFDAYVGGDNGTDDNTALLFGYYDFERDWIVIEDELILNNQTSKVIAEQAKEKERELWMTKTEIAGVEKWVYKGKHGKSDILHQPSGRVYDADAQVLLDMCGTEKYNVVLPFKHDRIAAIRAFRRRVQEGKFKVKKRCRVFRKQLKVGMWKNEKHLDFERSEDDNDLKHLDAIAAAVYFSRSIARLRNPYPPNTAVSPLTHLVPEDFSSIPSSPDDDALKKMLGI